MTATNPRSSAPTSGHRPEAEAEADVYDYIIVGSGAGGGPLAARLAEAGRRVLLLEAGADHSTEPPESPAREVTQVPALHGVSTEHDALSWRYFVRHYDKPPEPDPKWHDPGPGGDPAEAGIFYPRAAGLGGCTIHNAMITIVGPESDWDDLADLVADRSWGGAAMRQYFRRLERNGYLPKPRPAGFLRRLGESLRWVFTGRLPDATGGRHGFDGWLHTSVADVSLGFGDWQLLKMLKSAVKQSKRRRLETAGMLARRALQGRIREALDPNHAHTQATSPEGLVLVPLAVYGPATLPHEQGAESLARLGGRCGPRERLLDVRRRHPANLEIRTNCLVTEVILDEQQPPRAIGVRYLSGERLYRAHPAPRGDGGTPGEARVRPGGEVILCGGAFNTPQLLMLSGIGDPEHLGEHGIRCRVPLPGVGRNLQDRYEVTVISKMRGSFSLLEGADFRLPEQGQEPDRHLARWRRRGTGLYTSNGAVLGLFVRSSPDLAQPDLFIFGIPLPFPGYKVGYSTVGDVHDEFTWAILKGHTRCGAGTVRLRSADPRDTPLINFHSFNEGAADGVGDADPDLEALVEGVKFVRRIARGASAVVATEVHPGPDVNDDEQIKKWVRRDAWGHHACGTCRMGPDDDELAVLDSRFRVRGVNGLRVVDASIFPRIPGYFIVTNIYVASEKAADVILEDAAP